MTPKTPNSQTLKGTIIHDFNEKTIKLETTNFIKIQHQLLKDVLKDEISQVMVKNNEVWIVECDEIKNYKFYFPNYNASTLSYLQKKNTSKSLFS